MTALAVGWTIFGLAVSIAATVAVVALLRRRPDAGEEAAPAAGRLVTSGSVTRGAFIDAAALLLVDALRRAPGETRTLVRAYLATAYEHGFRERGALEPGEVIVAESYLAPADIGRLVGYSAGADEGR